ncbi:MAG: ATP-grasp domain-containing protein [Candidatus Pacearchaeota archaeon]|jgi:hypothetical protein
MNPENLNANEIFENLERHTSFKDDVVAWIGLRPVDFSSIQFAYPDAIASTRYGKESQLLERKYSLISTEKQTKTRTDSSLAEIEPYIDEFLKSFDGQPTHLVCYHSTSVLEEIAKNYPNVQILNPPARLKKFLDTKSKVRRELRNQGIKVIPGIEGVLEEDSFDKVSKLYGLPFFVQFDDSASGSGSYLIDSQSSFNELKGKYKNEPVTFMKFLQGPSLNINAVKTRNFTVLSEPSFQIIGDPLCTTRKFGYCGNDFHIGSKLSEEQMNQIFEMTKKIGKWIGSLGYYGVYGVDFISEGEDIYFTEINPRFQGSTSLVVDRQIETGKIPLSFFHLVPYLDEISVDPEIIFEYNKIKDPLNVSQILLHNKSRKNCILESSIMPGRYELSDNKLFYQGPGKMLSETQSYDEIIIAGDVPIDGTEVLRDSDEFCRIYTYKEVLDNGGKRLNSYGERLVNLVYKNFKFK